MKTEVSAVPPHNKDAATPDEVYKLSDSKCSVEDLQSYVCQVLNYKFYI